MINPINIGIDGAPPEAIRSVRLVNLMAVIAISFTTMYLIYYVFTAIIPAVIVSCCAILCYAMVFLFHRYHLFRLASIWMISVFSAHLFVLTFIIFTKETGLHYLLFSIPPAAFMVNGYRNNFDKILLTSIAFLFFLVCELVEFKEPIITLSDSINRGLNLFSLISIFIGVTVFVWLFTYDIHQHQISQEELIVKLDNSLLEISQLQGILPICASCKKIRDDKGYWNQIESYISTHSEAVFSHSICPECAEKLYPGLAHKEEDKDRLGSG